MTRYIQQEERKTTDPVETMKVFCGLNEDDLVPGIEEDRTPMSDLEDRGPVHVISDEREITRTNEKKLIRVYYPQERG